MENVFSSIVVSFVTGLCARAIKKEMFLHFFSNPGNLTVLLQYVLLFTFLACVLFVLIKGFSEGAKVGFITFIVTAILLPLTYFTPILERILVAVFY